LKPPTANMTGTTTSTVKTGFVTAMKDWNKAL
jgi:hypothetical protein